MYNLILERAYFLLSMSRSEFHWCWFSVYAVVFYCGTIQRFTIITIFKCAKQLCSYYHHLILVNFHYPKRKLYPLISHSSFTPPLSFRQTLTNLLSIPMDLPTLDILYKKSHTINMWPLVSGFFHLGCFQGLFML